MVDYDLFGICGGPVCQDAERGDPRADSLGVFDGPVWLDAKSGGPRAVSFERVAGSHSSDLDGFGFPGGTNMVKLDEPRSMDLTAECKWSCRVGSGRTQMFSATIIKTQFLSQAPR